MAEQSLVLVRRGEHVSGQWCVRSACVLLGDGSVPCCRQVFKSTAEARFAWPGERTIGHCHSQCVGIDPGGELVSHRRGAVIVWQPGHLGGLCAVVRWL
jgi:hypothetical protein